jgi:hypothetical protein
MRSTDETATNDLFRTYQPCSDFMISSLNSKLPRLIVEVNSKPKKTPPDKPGDLVRMLLMGASVVRFANRFLARFKERFDFVLFAIYISDDGTATRYSLFQKQGDNNVRWTSYVSKLAG